MEIPRLQIRQQYGRIMIETEKPELEIKQSKADMKINRPEVKIDINREEARVQIDNYPSRRDLNILNFVDLRKKIIRQAEKNMSETITRYAQNGDRLMRIEKDGNGLEEVIKEETGPEQKDITLKSLSGPEFKSIPGELDINFKEKRVDILARQNFPRYYFQWGRVDISMERYNKIEISVRGGRLNTRV